MKSAGKKGRTRGTATRGRITPEGGPVDMTSTAARVASALPSESALVRALFDGPSFSVKKLSVEIDRITKRILAREAAARLKYETELSARLEAERERDADLPLRKW